MRGMLMSAFFGLALAGCLGSAPTAVDGGGAGGKGGTTSGSSGTATVRDRGTTGALGRPERRHPGPDRRGRATRRAQRAPSARPGRATRLEPPVPWVPRARPERLARAGRPERLERGTRRDGGNGRNDGRRRHDWDCWDDGHGGRPAPPAPAEPLPHSTCPCGSRMRAGRIQSTSTCLHQGKTTDDALRSAHEDRHTLGGTPGTMYQVKIHVRGIVEPTTSRAARLATPANFVTGGYRACRQGNAGPGAINQWRLTTTVPNQIYYLNAYTSVGHNIYPIDYTETIMIGGGSVVKLDVHDVNAHLITNTSGLPAARWQCRWALRAWRKQRRAVRSDRRGPVAAGPVTMRRKEGRRGDLLYAAASSPVAFRSAYDANRAGALTGYGRFLVEIGCRLQSRRRRSGGTILTSSM